MENSWKIFKYPLAVLEKQDIELPENAKIIRAEDVAGHFFLWAIVNTAEDCPKEIRHIEFYKTGQPIDKPEELTYIGLCKLFVMMELGLYVFERKVKDCKDYKCNSENWPAI